MAGGFSVYVPIEGLTVSTPFPVGFITLRSAEDVLAQLDEPAPTNMRADLRERARDGNVTAFAEVPRDDVNRPGFCRGLV